MKEAVLTQVVKIVKNRKMKKSPSKIVTNDKKQKQNKPKEDAKDIKETSPVEEEIKAVQPKEPVVQQRRDFSTDLMGYISSWNYRETSGQWKFNKILQTWALDHCFDKKKIDPTLFKALMPYLLSIKGNAVDRLLVRAEEIITQCCENDENDDDEKDDDENDDTEEGKKSKSKESSAATGSGMSLKRAIKIKFEFSKLIKSDAK